MIKFKFYGRRKKYDKEFKLKVVEVSFARGKVKEVAEEYGIDPQMLSVWRSQYKNHKEIAFPGNGRKMQTEAENVNSDHTDHPCPVDVDHLKQPFF